MIFYTDKPEIFKCQISVEGASIDDTSVSLVLEGKKWNLVFYGNIDNSGKCSVLVPKLDVLKEGEVGKATLTVIAEDTRFIPYTGDFEVRTSKKVTIESIEISNVSSKNSVLELSKPKIRVENVIVGNGNQIQKQGINSTIKSSVINVPGVINNTTKTLCLNEIISIIKKNNITYNNFVSKKPLFKKIIIETIKKHNIDYKQNSAWIMKNMLDFFSKK